MNANLPEKPNHLRTASSCTSNNNNNNINSGATTTSTTTTSDSSSQSQLLGSSISNNNNNNLISSSGSSSSNNNHTTATSTASSSGGGSSGVDTVGTPSLRHQVPPPLPPAPVSRSPQVNRSTKPNINLSSNNNNNNNHSNIHSPVTLPALVTSSGVNSGPGAGITTSATPTLIFRRRPAASTIAPLVTSTVPTLSSAFQQFDPLPSSPVTLAQPRPENERLGNEYVDTPFSRAAAAAHSRHSTHSHPHSQLNTSSTVNNNNNNSHHHPHAIGHGLTAAATTTAHHGGVNAISTIAGPELLRPSTVAAAPVPLAITKQPVTTFTKDASPTSHIDETDFHSTNSGHAFNSIICPKCQRCRCEPCQRKRPLPTKWLCDDCCYVSAESVIDYMSCLCCVKALYYHCSKDHEFEHDSDSSTCADDPCSCGPQHFASRWGCMAALSLVLPCLWCYWPMRGCAAICSKCYAKFARHGCRCSASAVAAAAAAAAANANATSLSQPSKSGRSISSLLSRNSSTATTVTSNSHNHAPSSHQLNDRLLGSSPDY